MMKPRKELTARLKNLVPAFCDLRLADVTIYSYTFERHICEKADAMNASKIDQAIKAFHEKILALRAEWDDPNRTGKREVITQASIFHYFVRAV
ncbi:unnamed protein product [Blepharisma stoltei]|uniref:Uncharacterized protein n=1 Tax=Blepharisma stoltei TaxID=1481888 RepID=A0AAU9KAM7_9CILI|nr:unnamed protein product [Blepharisma stoltei]